MSYAVEIVLAVGSELRALMEKPSQRLPFLHDTLEEARSAGLDFLRDNGAYIASKGPRTATALFQIVDDAGEIVEGALSRVWTHKFGLAGGDVIPGSHGGADGSFLADGRAVREDRSAFADGHAGQGAG